MKKNRFIKNTVIYFLLIIGFVAFYILDIKSLINPPEERPSKSKVEFIYQQF